MTNFINWDLSYTTPDVHDLFVEIRNKIEQRVNNVDDLHVEINSCSFLHARDYYRMLNQTEQIRKDYTDTLHQIVYLLDLPILIGDNYQ